MTRKISEAHIAHAKSLVEAGSTVALAASRIGVSADVLSQKLRAQGVKIRRTNSGLPAHNRLALPETAIVEAYIAGTSELALATEYGTSRLPIQRILRDHGIQRRSGSEANLVRMDRLDLEQRRELVAEARRKRVENMQDLSHDNPAIGAGENEIAQLLEQAGYPIIRQQLVGPYLIDIAIDEVAMEIKLKPRRQASETGRNKRSEYLCERGKRLVIICFNDLACLLRHGNHILSLIDVIRRAPPIRGEYWVVRCYFEELPGDIELNEWSMIHCTPKTATAGG